MIPSVGQYVNYLQRAEGLRTKKEQQSFQFRFYETQSSSYSTAPLKLYSPGVDFNPKFNDAFSSVLYPRPVHLTQQSEPQMEHERGLYADEINNFLDPFFVELHQEKLPVENSERILQDVIGRLQTYAKGKTELLNDLMQSMNVSRLIIPYVEINLPGDLILAYNELEPEDPQVPWYQNHPLLASDIRLLGTFLDRFDTNSEVLCLIVWSKVDSVLINLPSVGLNPYPLCWNCKKSFGMHVCGSCQIAKYCSKDCQVRHWSSEHGAHSSLCHEIKHLATQHRVLELGGQVVV